MALLYGDLDLRDLGQVVGAAHPPPHPVPHRRQWQPGPGARRPGGRSARWRWPATACPPAAPSATRSSTAPTASPPPSSSRRSTRPARWRARSPAPSAPCTASARVRVHLVLPRREPFARDRQDAQASVMLTMAGAGRLDREGIQAILNLVAAAVPGLRPQNIAIVDSRGDLLARAGEPVGPPPRRRSPPRRCGAPPNCACRARWRRCWSAASAPATCAPRRRCA